MIISIATKRPITQRPETGHLAAIIAPSRTEMMPLNKQPSPVPGASKLKGHDDTYDAQNGDSTGQQEGEEDRGNERPGKDIPADQDVKEGESTVPRYGTSILGT